MYSLYSQYFRSNLEHTNLGVKTVVVFAGANHRKYMQDIFSRMPGVKVQNINEVK